MNTYGISQVFDFKGQERQTISRSVFTIKAIDGRFCFNHHTLRDDIGKVLMTLQYRDAYTYGSYRVIEETTGMVNLYDEHFKFIKRISSDELYKENKKFNVETADFLKKQDEVKLVKKNGKAEKKQVLNNRGDLKPFQDPLTALWGYKDKAGNIRVQAKFTAASQLRDGIAQIREGDSYCLMDKEGKMLFRDIYRLYYRKGHYLMNFHQHSIVYNVKSKKSVRRNRLKNRLNEDLFVTYMSPEGLIDYSGKTVVKSKHSYIYALSDDCLALSHKHLYRIKDGKRFGPYQSLRHTNSGLISAIHSHSRGDLYTPQGIQVAKNVDEISYFDNFITFKDKDGFKIINSKGLILGQYDKLAHSNKFNEKRFPVQKNGLWGYVDEFGKLVIKCQFIKAEEFHRKRAVVATKSGYGLISKNGKVVIPLKYEKLQSHYEGEGIRDDKGGGYTSYERKGTIKKKWGLYGENISPRYKLKFEDNKITLLNSKNDVVLSKRNSISIHGQLVVSSDKDKEGNYTSKVVIIAKNKALNGKVYKGVVQTDCYGYTLLRANGSSVYNLYNPKGVKLNKEAFEAHEAGKGVSFFRNAYFIINEGGSKTLINKKGKVIATGYQVYSLTPHGDIRIRKNRLRGIISKDGKNRDPMHTRSG